MHLTNTQLAARLHVHVYKGREQIAEGVGSPLNNGYTERLASLIS